MGNQYWIGSDSSWNTASNWESSPGATDSSGPPGSADDVIFDGSDVTNCTCDVAIDIASLNVQSGYSGILDFGDSSYSHAISGNMTFDGTGTVDCGNATITCGGDFDHKDQATWTHATSTIVMTGTSVDLVSHNKHKVKNLTISGSVELMATTDYRIEVAGILSVTATGTFTISQRCQIEGGADCRIASGGTLNGTNQLILTVDSSMSVVDGTLEPATIEILDGGHTLGGGTWGSSSTSTTFKSTVAGQLLEFSNATYTFPGNVTWRGGSEADYMEVANDHNNPSFVFQGDVTITDASALLDWTAGSGTITLSGTDQTVDFAGETTEPVVIDSDGTITLAGDWDVDGAIQINDGNLDIDGYTLTADSFQVDPTSAAVEVTDSNAGVAPGSIDLTGALTLNGTSSYGVTWEVDGTCDGATSSASYTTVNGSEMIVGGTDIDATDNCAEGDPTIDGWDFGGGAPATTNTMMFMPF